MKKCLLAILLIAAAAWMWFAYGPRSAESGAIVDSASNVAPLEQLLEKSRAADKPLVLLFTGSSWCPPCKRLKGRILSTPEWKELVREEILFAVYDFPRGGGGSGPAADRRDKLALYYGVRTFPTLLVVGPGGKPQARLVGFPGGEVEDYERWIENAI